MNDHDNLQNQPLSYSGTFRQSRAGIVLLVFLAVAALLLIYEHRVHVFTGSGVLVGLLALCIGMHFFMHGGHGGHGGASEDKNQRKRL